MRARFMPRVALSMLVLHLLLALATLSAARACTAIAVSRGASTDGSVYIARTDDAALETANSLLAHPPRAGPAIYRANGNTLAVELPAPGLAYLALPVTLPDPAAGRNASGESAGVSAAGVAVSATVTLVNHPRALAADPYTPGGLTEDSIPSLLLPQATSARQGAALLGQLVTTWGAGEGFSTLVADAREAWVLETASGHHWLAARVPPGALLVSANQGRLQEVDLGDDASVLASTGLLRFAADAGLWDPAAGRRLNFSAAFMQDGAADALANYPRVCTLQRQLAAGAAGACDGAPTPTFARPAATVGLAQVVAGLRNHYAGSEHDAYAQRHGWGGERWRPVALLRTSMGHVTRLRPPELRLPPALASILYVAQGMPALSPFVPIYAGLPAQALPPQLVRTGSGAAPDPASLLWRARRLQAVVMQDWPGLAASAGAGICAWEQDVERVQRPAFELRYLDAARHGDGTEAAELLAAFTADVVQQAMDMLERLTEEAAKGLGMRWVPPDEELAAMLAAASEEYSFRGLLSHGDS